MRRSIFSGTLEGFLKPPAKNSAGRSPTSFTRSPPWALLVLGALLGLAGAPVGCGADDVGPESRMVGGRCTTDNDCVKRCLVNVGNFPGGYCTVSCTSNSDCPGGAACVAIEGGVCLATCTVTKDCDGYGAGYQCTRQTSQSPGTGPLACIGG